MERVLVGNCRKYGFYRVTMRGWKGFLWEVYKNVHEPQYGRIVFGSSSVYLE